MEQGTGKTRVAIDLIHSTDSEYVLFICPNSTKTNLLNEIEKWGLAIDYEVISYEAIASSDRQYGDLLEKLESIKSKIFIVADESTFIKNENAKRTQRVSHIAQFSEYRLILNGTPITKNEWDIYNQMYFLSPKIINMSQQEFLNNFFTRVEYKKKFQSPKVFYKLSEVNIDVLKKLIEPYIFKADYQFNKNISENWHEINASHESIVQYNCEKEVLLNKIKEEQGFLDVLVNMQYIMFTDEDRCKKIAEKLEGQVIVYCNYLHEVDQIAKHLDCYFITGSTDQDDRTAIFDQFKHDVKPLLMTYGVGSFGLNLQFCNHIAFASLTFDYSKIEQSQARIKRLGQNKDIKYTYFTSDLGLYDLILNNISNKRNLSDLLIEEVKEVMTNESLPRKERVGISL